MLADDAKRMREAGFSVVRMGEFSWHLYEPEEGQFDFGWLEEAISVLAEEGIQTMLCTPTAAPPRWLTYRYPDVLRHAAGGQPLRHGSRQHASHFSPQFMVFSRRITHQMAEHFQDNPHVIGWQTDNEFHCHFAEDHSPAAQEGFREFLTMKYQGDIELLNQAWGADFWAMSYQNFEQIETPIANRPTHLNPSHVLDYQRCLSWGVTRFQRQQIDILREVQDSWWITHNGCFASIDYRGPFTEDLDFLAYDSYPFFDTDPGNRRFSHAFNLDAVRAFSGNFMIPEQQSGPGGQTGYLHDTPEPGEMRRMALASIAHGADALLFFRWRSCRFGAEEYWCGLLDHDNRPGRRLQEAGQLGEELQRLGPELMGSEVWVEVGVAGGDFDSQMAHESLHHGLPGPRQSAETVHGVLNARQQAVGIVHPADDLQHLRVYLIPHMPLFRPEWIPALEEWVKKGGTLVVGPRCGTKDHRNQVISTPAPGCLVSLTGTVVQEMGRQNRPDLRPLTFELQGETLCSDQWYEVLLPLDDTEALARWNSRHLTGTAAITSRRLGKGRVLHVGTWLTAEITCKLLDWLETQELLPPAKPFPEGVEVIERLKPDGSRLQFLINHTDTPINVSLSAPGTELLSGRERKGEGTLPAHEVWAIKLDV